MEKNNRQRLLVILLIVAAAVALAAFMGFFYMFGKYRAAVEWQQESFAEETLGEEVPEEEIAGQGALAEELSEEIPDTEETGTSGAAADGELPAENADSGEAAEAESAQRTDLDAQQGAEELFSRLLAYSAGDEAAFDELFIGVSSEEVQVYREDFTDLREQNFEKQFVTVAVDANPYFLVQVCSYTVTGVRPDAVLESLPMALIISNTGSGWKVDYTDAALEAMITDESMAQLYPDGLLEALAAGRNSSIFQAYYLWRDEEHAFEGIFDAELFFLWQNEDGSVDAAVWFGNGTDEAMDLSKVYITVTDNVLGTVLDISGEISETVKAGCGKTVVYHIDASEVLTGTSAWSSLTPLVRAKT